MLPEQIGPYEIDSEIGHGATATVYLAADGQDRRAVAVKVLRPEYVTDLGYRSRFEREAQTIAALQHPAIVPLFDFGQHEGQLYIAMAYMPGGTLARPLLQGPLSLQETARILGRVGAALDYAHGRGVIHRDLKPSNVLFDADGLAYLADFGIAVPLEDNGGSGSLLISGTPAYMSPEQARREQAVDRRSDLYALGVIAFQMVTGTLPYEGDSPISVLLRHIQETPPAPSEVKPDLPQSLDPVLLKAMARDPAQRFQDAGSFAAAFNEAAEVEEVGVLPVQTPSAALAAEETPGAAPPLLLAADGAPAAGALADSAGPAHDEGDKPHSIAAFFQATRRRLQAGYRLLADAVLPALGRAVPWLKEARAALGERPHIAFVLVSLLGVLCAAWATLAFRGPALLETIRAGAVARASPPSPRPEIYLPLAIAGVTPTAAPPTAVPTPAPNLLLIYTESAVTAINVSGASLSLSGVTFQRPADDEWPDAVFSANEWRAVAGSTVNALPAGDCFQLLDLGPSGRTQGPQKPGQCEKLQGWLATSRADRLFFRPDREPDAFQVFRGDQFIQACTISQGLCQFHLPQS